MVKNNLCYRKFIITFFIGLLFFVFISNPFDYYFLNDDFIHIPKAAKGELFQSHSLLRPISEITLWIDSKLWGKNSYGFHISNMVIHLSNVLFVFIVSKKIYNQVVQNHFEKSVIPIIASTLFLLYSFHSESIYWIIGRGASLTTLFFFAAFSSYLDSKKIFDKNFFLCLLFFVLGLLTYELIWVFPLIILSFSIFFKPRKKYLVLFIWLLFITFVVLKIFLTNTLVSAYEARSIAEIDIKKLVYNLNTLIARSILPPLKSSSAFLGLYIFLLSLLVLFIFKNRGNKLMLFYVFSFLISFLPTISMGIDTHDTESERFIYLASFFFIMILVEIILYFNKRALFPAFIFFVCVYSFFLYKSASSYKYASTLAKTTLYCLDRNQLFDKIFLYNLPTQYKGALIFRIGFPEALSWINNITWNEIHVVSTSEVKNKKDFNCIKKIAVNGIVNPLVGTDLKVRWEDETLNILKSNLK